MDSRLAVGAIVEEIKAVAMSAQIQRARAAGCRWSSGLPSIFERIKLFAHVFMHGVSVSLSACLYVSTAALPKCASQDRRFADGSEADDGRLSFPDCLPPPTTRAMAGVPGAAKVPDYQRWLELARIRASAQTGARRL